MATEEKMAAFEQCMQEAQRLFDQQDWQACFYLLENAHVLGQKNIGAHTLSHYWMLRVGWKQRNWKEIWGQLFRMVASPIITPIWVPLGNTGGAGVSAIKPMPLREELKPYFEQT
ncbi:DUF3703 domain-containing protein [Pseudoteredinibacter isoporae]|uniref:DUF3703 domain-containing protein n=1 Tax=Pseudoteredinibacter isoporae TaxID=570281 RepID=A0A7X0JTL4_9GAMM|nr:DUF3703 domain-containing protein [Pseudoteredinibacter isoporae]MBB6522009.1 hypothetical protein [Pseudoteredinibacter isoporae]NHO87545.1 DUF3703 domain-containing protein [Pseudoteredinibacter isoporae]NIB24124.1 DUF3703 domain-containing protein [Pseudoteredinibacter isoporae]